MLIGLAHGKEKKPTWTLLEGSIYKGTSFLRLMYEVNWEIGDYLVIASTDFDHEHSEYV